jgi:hypothetical protein
MVRVLAEPLPALTKVPGPRWAPGWTRIRFDPMDAMLDWIEFAAPCPIDTIAITEPMPITIPKIVSPVLALLTVIDDLVSCNKSAIFMSFFALSGQ